MPSPTTPSLTSTNEMAIVSLPEVSAQDRTMSREAVEAELKKALREVAHLRMISSKTLHAVTLTNAVGEIEWVNKAFTKLTGYDQCEVLGKQPGEILTGPNTDKATLDAIYEKLSLRQPIDTEILNYHRDGRSYWIHLQIQPVFDDDGKLTNFISTQADISDKKEQAERLNGSQQIYQDLFETTRDAILSLGKEGFFNCNDAALKLFGFDTIEEFCACGPSDVSPEFQPDGRRSEDAAKEVVSRAFQEGLCRFEWQHCHRDGTTFDAEVVLSRYQVGSEPVLQASVRDISERKAAEAELIDAKVSAEHASQAKSEFLANMSHEIRTPLNGILGFTEVLKNKEYPPAKRGEYLDLIHKSGQHLLGLINDILDLSKVESGKMEFECRPCSIWQIVDEVVSGMKIEATRKNLFLHASTNGPLPANIQSDPIRLKQLLTNLMGNALKFTESGGVSLSVECSANNSPSSPHEADIPTITLEVKDTGIGMSEEAQQQIFTAFNQADNSITRRFGGTGLGLTISRRIVEALGGQLQVESTQGVGSLFRIVLPVRLLADVEMIIPSPMDRAEEERQSLVDLQPVDQEHNKLSSAYPSSRLAGRQVLLCDDGETNRELVELILSEAGVEVTSAINGKLGVQEVQRAPDQFDIVLMDMQMPVMDGYSAASALREIGYSRPILALTAHAMRGDSQRCIDAGCTGYLTKPIDIAQLLQAVEDAIEIGSSQSNSTGVDVAETTSTKNYQREELASINGRPSRSPISSTLPIEMPAFAAIVNRFIEELPDQIKRMEDACEQSEWNHLKKQAHALKGAGGTVGFDCFTTIAEQLEQASCNRNHTDVLDQLSMIQSLAERLEKA